MTTQANDTTGFKRAEIQVWAKLGANGEWGAVPAPAMVKGRNAVHRNLIWIGNGKSKPGFGGSWAVSHVNSGMRYLVFTSLNAAKAFASRVDSLGIPGLDDLKTGGKPEWSKKQMRELREAVRGLAAQCTDEYGGTFS